MRGQSGTAACLGVDERRVAFSTPLWSYSPHSTESRTRCDASRSRVRSSASWLARRGPSLFDPGRTASIYLGRGHAGTTWFDAGTALRRSRDLVRHLLGTLDPGPAFGQRAHAAD